MTLTLGQFRPATAAAPAVASVARDTSPGSASPSADTFGSIMEDTLVEQAAGSSVTASSKERKTDRARDCAPESTSTGLPEAAADSAPADPAIPTLSPASFSAALTWTNAAGVAAEPAQAASAAVAVGSTASGSTASGSTASGSTASEITASGSTAETVPVDVEILDGSAGDATPAPAAATAAEAPVGDDSIGAQTDTAFLNVAALATGVAGRATAARGRSDEAATGATTAPGAAATLSTRADAAVLPAHASSAVPAAIPPASASMLASGSTGAVLGSVLRSVSGSAPDSAPDSLRLAGTSTAAATPAAPVAPALPPTLPPAVPPTLPTAATAPVAAPAPAATVPLTTQIMKPLFSLTSAAPGEHVLTISVTPDNLGPVTVRAHVSGEGIRVELFAPTDLAREALRVILPDLRRDLAGSGLSAQLDLSSDSQARDPGAARQPRAETDGRNPDGRSPNGRAADTPQEIRTPRFGSTHTIDVLA
ncbi:flagellar hook-length control protein FliK [Cryobacterium gelidum]|uniref:Flagellar hook-length control protein FliK n=1 Tax=Cryobacterium gelidum TaxID=1259164 RepID=A0A4R9AR57_9MICO|nr:flagellar hook-length control protein FliK [Cryobacterium gelidum]TFD68328.1 flagellar hook-length control protein FliK [Cryobacterium gelidum]